jgi:hypothetical protein
MSIARGDMVTAIHEAGHAWAYCQQRRSIRYLTIRPRGLGVVGRTAVRAKLVPDFDAGYSAIAGPIAQAVWSMGHPEDEWGLDWDDYFTGALLSGGHDDMERIPIWMLDNSEYVGHLRDAIEQQWPRLVTLAEHLVEIRTMDGSSVRSILEA